MALHADDVSQPVGAWTRLHVPMCVHTWMEYVLRGRAAARR